MKLSSAMVLIGAVTVKLNCTPERFCWYLQREITFTERMLLSWHLNLRSYVFPLRLASIKLKSSVSITEWHFCPSRDQSVSWSQ